MPKGTLAPMKTLTRLGERFYLLQNAGGNGRIFGPSRRNTRSNSNDAFPLYWAADWACGDA